MKRSAAGEEEEADFRIYGSSDDADDDTRGTSNNNYDGYESGSSTSSSSPSNIPLDHSNDDGDDSMTKIVDTEFEFYDPLPKDIDRVSWYLRDYPGGCGWDVANAVCEQRRVGTVVKLENGGSGGGIDGGGDVVGVISVLNCVWFREVLKGLRAELEGKSRGGSDGMFRRELEDMFGRDEDNEEGSGKRTGLVVMERVVNLPGELVPTMHQALFDEIKWATEDEPSQALRDSFKFEQYLMITNCFVDGSGRAGNKGISKKAGRRRRKKKRRVKGDELAQGVVKTGELAFARPDDEAWYRYSSLSITWPLPHDPSMPRGLTKYRIAMILPANKVGDMRERTKELVLQSRSGNGHPGPDSEGP